MRPSAADSPSCHERVHVCRQAGGKAARTQRAAPCPLVPNRLRSSPLPLACLQVASLEGPLRDMLGWSAMCLGYIAFDGEVGGGGWGSADRTEAVRMFGLAACCGCFEAEEVLGWVYNTGQYG